MAEAWIIDAARTPRGIGKAGRGALSAIHPQRILATVLRALADRNGLDTADIDDVIIGCAVQMGEQSQCIARMAALDADYDRRATAFNLDRFCGSGMTSVSLGAMGIMSGQQDLIVAGGIEKMSMIPTVAIPRMQDSGNASLRAKYPIAHQGLCADLIASIHGIGREAADRLALESQRRAAVAIADGRFDRSLVPVLADDGAVALARDEFPRPQTTAEALASLQPVFAGLYDEPTDAVDGLTYRQLIARAYPDLAMNPIHHAGNSSGVVDGAAGLVLASPDYARAQGWRPRARIKAVSAAGGDPVTMLDAPADAARKILAKTGMAIGDIDLIEVNEAFAAIPIRFMDEMGLSDERVNVNGGAIALGHPIGATGAILIGTLLDELERRDLTTGLATMCTGGGMAPAVIIERI